MVRFHSAYRTWLFASITLAILFAFGMVGWICVEKALFGEWPPSLRVHYLHLLRGTLIVFLTSLVATAVIMRIKAVDIARLEVHKAFATELIETSHNLIVGLRTDGTIFIFNEKMEALTGYDRQEVLGRNWFELFIPAEDRESMMAQGNKLLSGGQMMRGYRSRLQTRSGETKDVLWNAALIRNEKGRNVGFMGIGADLTETVKLAEKVNLFSNAFEHSTDALLITDLEGRITQVNTAFSKIFGYSPGEVIGATTKVLRSRYSTDEFYRQMWDSILSKGEWKGDIVNRAKDGTEIPVWLSITPIFYEGHKAGYMAVEIDMREKKELERRALEAERLAAMGRMSSQVAHEVRNPLSSISLNVELLREELDALRDGKNRQDSQEAYSLLTAIEKEVDRLGEIAGDYLKFSRLPQHKKEKTDVNELLSGIFAFLREEGRRRKVEISFRPLKTRPAAYIDPKQMEQAVLNLVKNAFDAMPEGGKVEVGVADEADSMLLSVSDSGTGMDEETRKKIFNPFFTTKKTGTGLGLSLVHQVVSEHEGKVWCESAPGRGTTFFIRIPKITKEPLQK